MNFPVKKAFIVPELKIVDTQNLSAQARAELDGQVDALIARQKNNRHEINQLVFEGAMALAAGNKAVKSKTALGFFKRHFTGKNNRAQNDINQNLVEAQYAAQQTLQKLAEQNLLSFELIAAVNNKLNAAVLEVNDEINDLIKTMLTFFKNTRAKIVDLETKLATVEQNVNLLTWQNSIEYQMYNGVEYQDLDDVTKIVCLVRDFYDITKGTWRTSDLLLLKTAMATVGLNPKSKIDYEKFVRQVGTDAQLYNYLLGEDSRLDKFATEYETIIFILREIHAGGIFVADKTSNEVTAYEFILELLYNLHQLQYAKEFHDKRARAQELFIACKIDEALPILREPAAYDDARARYMLAIIYYEGLIVKANFTRAQNLLESNIAVGDVCSIFFGVRVGIVEAREAARYFDTLKTAADGSDVFAQFELAKYYSDYLPAKAMKYLERAAEQNYFLAAHEFASAAYNYKDYTTAKKYFEFASDMGHGQSTLRLGDIYWHGDGVPVDKEKAVELYKSAYERGASNDHSINEIAISFIKNGKLKDDATAVLRWWRIGAEKDYPTCIENLGWAYLHGHGVKSDWAEAIKYFEQAIQLGENDGYSEKHLGDIYFAGGHGITRDRWKAAEWYSKALDKGWSLYITILEELGNFCENTIGRNGDYKQDYALAVKFYEEVVHRGKNDGYCEKHLGDIYFKGGYGIKQDYSKAVEWYEKARTAGRSADDLMERLIIASANSAEKLFHIGMDYEYGNNCTKDSWKAVEYYKRSIAAGLNNGYPEEHLGDIYSDIDGQHSQRFYLDYKTAIECYNRACAKGRYFSADKLCDIGSLCENGYRSFKDYALAVEYYEESIHRGKNDGYCEKHLGDIYFAGGHGVERNYFKAVYWYNRARDKGRSSDDLIENLAYARRAIGI